MSQESANPGLSRPPHFGRTQSPYHKERPGPCTSTGRGKFACSFGRAKTGRGLLPKPGTERGRRQW